MTRPFPLRRKTAGPVRNRLALLAGALAVGLAFSSIADARERNRSVSRETSAGSFNRQSQVQAGPGYRSATRSQSGPNGGSRSVERGHEDGNRYREISGTTASGDDWSRSRSRSRSASIEDGTLNRSRSVSGIGGASAGSSGSVSHDENGVSRSVYRNGPNGGSVSRETSHEH